MGLRTKVLLPLLLSVLLLASYLYGYWLPRLLADVESEYQSALNKHLDSVAEGLVPLILGKQLDAVYGNLDALLKKNETWVGLELFDPQGRLLYPLEVPLVSKEQMPHDVRIVKQDIRYLDTKLGNLVVKVRFTEKLDVIKRQYVRLLYLFSAVMFLFFLTIGFILELIVRRPIKLLADASQQLAEGEVGMHLPRTGNDEIGTLMKSFVTMRDAISLNTGRLTEANEQLRLEVMERKRAEEDIRKSNENLELKVEERTKQLLDAQEELVRKEKLATLGQLSGSVGHELRNPLGVMSNAVYYLKTVMSGPEETVKEYLDIIKSEIDNSQRIITDLLDCTRTKLPQSELITVDELMKRSLGKCTIPGNVTLQLAIPDTIPVVKVDPLQIVQVFVNFITNAVQAMPGGGSVRVNARIVRRSELRVQSKRIKSELITQNPELDAGFVEISVADTGVGITPENMKKLFQPLFTTKAKGIGLGLVVCKNLVEANGGKIEVESEFGKGTTFTLLLPAEESEP